MPDPKQEEKIYLTYKTRMTTEARLRKTALLFHILLSWYSLCLIVLSLMDISRKFEIENSNLISACVSVAIFGLSLFIYGERYNERADEFKSCYLKLKELYECPNSIPNKMRRYAEILQQYDNQSDEDYDDMLFDAYLRGQSLRNADGPVRITKIVFCRVLFWRLVRRASIAALFAAPVIAGALWVRPIGTP
jgi:hypothetical protein